MNETYFVISPSTTAPRPVSRVAMYARVSSERQADEETIASQVAAIRERIATDGCTLDGEFCFVDDGVSGTTLLRPALEKRRDAAYRYVPRSANGEAARYEIVPEHAAVVRQMFEWVGRDRLSLAEVRRPLRQQGTPSPTGRATWDRATVWGLLRNPAFDESVRTNAHSGARADRRVTVHRRAGATRGESAAGP